MKPFITKTHVQRFHNMELFSFDPARVVPHAVFAFDMVSIIVFFSRTTYELIVVVTLILLQVQECFMPVTHETI